eukprot:1143946-Pelagomonas_calceolata.AAC.1
MSWVHKRSDACSESGALSCSGICCARTGRACHRNGLGLTVGVRGRQRLVISCLKRVVERGYGAGSATVLSSLVDRGLMNSLPCHFIFGIPRGVICLEMSHCDDHGPAGRCEVIIQHAFPFFSKAELTKVDTAYLTGPHAKKERKKDLRLRSAACIKERASHWLPPIEGIFISTPATRIQSGDLLLAVALLALDQGSKSTDRFSRCAHRLFLDKSGAFYYTKVRGCALQPNRK